MPRALRHEYPGAVYHVMARGDGGKAIFEGDDYRKAFLFRLGQVCGSHGWRCHARVLMGNHFHLLLLRKHTSAGNRWLAQHLAMGHTGSVSRLVVAYGKKKANRGKLRELEKILKCRI